MELFAKPGVAGIIEKTVDGTAYVLLQERYKADAPNENGLLEIPAGKIRQFENVYDCLRREIKEETGLEVTEIVGEDRAEIVECNGYKVVNYVPFSCSQNLEGNYPIMVQAFLCKVRGEVLTESDESKNIRWMSLDELEDLLGKNESLFYPMHITTLKNYIKKKQNRKSC